MTNPHHLLALTVRESYHRLPIQSAPPSLFSATPSHLFISTESDVKREDLSEIKNIYSPVEIPELRHSHNQTRHTEITYDLASVFDPSAYPTAKKRHKHLKYPFTWIKNNYIQIKKLQREHLPAIENLHNTWRERLFENEKLFRIMFPTARYLRCAKLAVREIRSSLCYLGLGAFYRTTGNLIAVRVIGVEDNRGFDLAFFGEREPSQLMNYLEIVTLARLMDLYPVKTFNCGATMRGGGQNLDKFKRHLPHSTIHSYKYTKKKKQ